MNILREIINDHIKHRREIWMLAKSDLSKAYTGSLFGWSWAIISPSITLFVFWFAFAVGMRSGRPVEGYPYFLWLFAGMIPWFCIRDMFSGGASALRRYTFLITKIKYPISTIPTFVSLSSLIVHVFLAAIMLLVFMLFGYKPDIYWLQLPFYVALMFIFFNTWALFAGVLGAISRDFLNLVKAITTALMWMSGIFYEVNSIDYDLVRQIMLLNPITIIVNGYRNCLIYKQWFWETPRELLNYSVVFAVMLMLAVWAYKKLRKDIPDVL